MKIGIFGGTFDPPHLGHLILAEFVRDSLNLEQVWLAPALKPPHKTDQEVTPIKHRYRMVELACGDDPFIKPSDIDITHNRQPSYTIDLLDNICHKYPEKDFILIIGTDSVVEFTTWERWEQILQNYYVVAVKRPNFEISRVSHKILKSIKILDNPLIELSSTKIRERIANGHSVRYMVPEPVLIYILKENIYSG